MEDKKPVRFLLKLGHNLVLGHYLVALFILKQALILNTDTVIFFKKAIFSCVSLQIAQTEVKDEVSLGCVLG